MFINAVASSRLLQWFNRPTASANTHLPAGRKREGEEVGTAVCNGRIRVHKLVYKDLDLEQRTIPRLGFLAFNSALQKKRRCVHQPIGVPFGRRGHVRQLLLIAEFIPHFQRQRLAQPQHNTLLGGVEFGLAVSLGFELGLLEQDGVGVCLV